MEDGGRVTLKSLHGIERIHEDQCTLLILLPSQAWLSLSRKSESSPDFVVHLLLIFSAGKRTSH